MFLCLSTIALLFSKLMTNLNRTAPLFNHVLQVHYNFLFLLRRRRRRRRTRTRTRRRRRPHNRKHSGYLSQNNEHARINFSYLTRDFTQYSRRKGPSSLSHKITSDMNVQRHWSKWPRLNRPDVDIAISVWFDRAPCIQTASCLYLKWPIDKKKKVRVTKHRNKSTKMNSHSATRRAHWHSVHPAGSGTPSDWHKAGRAHWHSVKRDTERLA